MFTRVCGIPCQAVITSYYPGSPARLWGHPDSWEPADYAEVEFQVCDRRGRPASWLEKKMSPVERRRIESELIAYCENRDEDF